MIDAVAFLPAPPILVPAVARGAGPELDGVRAACRAALELVLASADQVLLIGPADWPRPGQPAPGLVRRWPAGGRGTLAGIGVPMTASFGDEAAASSGVAMTASFGDEAAASSGVAVTASFGDEAAASSGVAVTASLADRAGASTGLPLSLTVGAWLLAESGWRGAAAGLAVPTDLAASACREEGLAVCGQARGRRTALVVLGEGSARRTAAAPGSFDAAAEPYDAVIEAALTAADATTLLGLAPTVGTALLVSGRAPWQVAAAAADADPGMRWRGRLLAAQAPYGVGYLVATWVRG